jgi:hypothetical protein
MSQSFGGEDLSGKVAEGSGIKQYYLVIEGTAGNQAKVSGTAAEYCLGFVQTGALTSLTDIAAGKPLAIRNEGTSKAVASGIINRNAYVTSNGDGKIKATTTDKEFVMGRSLEAAGADGDIIEVEVMKFTLSI